MYIICLPSNCKDNKESKVDTPLFVDVELPVVEEVEVELFELRNIDNPWAISCDKILKNSSASCCM